MPDTLFKDLPAKALVDFDYTYDGRTFLPLKAGDPFNVAAHHYPGLLGAGMIEAASPAKHDEQLAAGEAALAEPVRDRVARMLAEREAQKPAKGKAAASAPKEG